MRLQCPTCAAVLELARRPSFCAECGTPLPPELTEVTPPDPNATTAEPSRQDVADSPQRVGGYRLLRQLGAGGMGSVWEGEDDTGRRVAVKLIAPEVAASPEAVARFRREGRLASGLSHPRCVFVLAADEDGGRPYLVMELMPGDNLKDEVERRGPLPINEAVAHILDVAEGLSEAHRQGIVHRDVKPSNCFLEADGRVKIGDFGLSKSLTADADVSRSGTFLGTPLFASPEQIRRENVDARSDVYSTAATLYYLLAGRAPFQSGDAAAVMARILADPVPPLRRFRPDVPRGLERVILRGLERDPARRWQSLDEFRAALTPFVPGRLTFAGLGLRFVALFIDSTLFSILMLGVAMPLLGSPGPGEPVRLGAPVNPFVGVFGHPAQTVYFCLLEGLYGWSLGKWLLGLRVCPPDGTDPPGLRRSLVRALAFYLFVCLPLDAMAVASAYVDADVAGLFLLNVLVWAGILGSLLGLGLLAAPMRATNGYRGLHEILSGTRTVLLPWPEQRRRILPNQPPSPLVAAVGLPTRLGPFTVSGVLGGDGARLLLGCDPGLERPVCLRVRPVGAPLSSARRGLGRPGRLRWLASGQEGDISWDAFAAPQGVPLYCCVSPARPLPWPETRMILTQLADELAAAAGDGTLPEALGVDQVYVQPSGRTQLLDLPPGPTAAEGDADARSLALLRQTAVLALVGRRGADDSAAAVRAPLPLHAARIVDRLTGAGQQYATLAEFRAELDATRDRPATLTVPLRATHFGILLALLFIPLTCMGSSNLLFASGAYAFLAVETPSCERNLELLPAWREEVAQAVRDRFNARQAEARASPTRQHIAADRATAAVPVLEWLLLTAAAPPQPALARRLCDEAAACRRRQGQLAENEEQLVRRLDEEWGEARQRRSLAALDADLAGERASLESLVAELRIERDRRRRAIEGWLGASAVYLAVLDEIGRSEAARRDVYLGAEPPPTAEYTAVLATVGLLFSTGWPAALVLWTFLVRGGLSYRLAGLLPVRADGARAGRFRLAWRTLIVWGPTAAALAMAVLAEWDYPEVLGLPQAVFALAWVWLVVLAVSGLRDPTRALHDRLSGVTLVPR